MRQSLVALALVFPVAAFAVGADEDPPEPTPTTTECTGGQVWDAAGGTCVEPGAGLLDDDTLYRAAREFAWAGQFENALGALTAMSNPREDRVLTYMGFTLRKSGEMDRGLAYYEAALRANPDNLLARSYMGQAYVELGATDKAREQLTEIRVRGGAGTWPETALEQAIRVGYAENY